MKNIQKPYDSTDLAQLDICPAREHSDDASWLFYENIGKYKANRDDPLHLRELVALGLLQTDRLEISENPLSEASRLSRSNVVKIGGYYADAEDRINKVSANPSVGNGLKIGRLGVGLAKVSADIKKIMVVAEATDTIESSPCFILSRQKIATTISASW